MTATSIPPVIGVFDSGFGGLTVLRALLRRFPGTHFVYLGDTARLPYGAKSQATVARYAVEAARFLVTQGAEMLVIACNTATALALPEIRAAVTIPVVGVVRPGAEAALQATTSHPVLSTGPPLPKPVRSPQPPLLKPVISTEADLDQRSGVTRSFGASATGTSQPHILVLATPATVVSHAYRDTCATLGLRATEMPCPLLVPLVEEGWTDHPVTRDVLHIYLTQALEKVTPDAVVLGCTHYPLLVPAITATLRALGCQAPVVDSAEATAAAAQALWPHTSTSTEPPTYTCYATDSVEKFARLGSHFLGQPIAEVHLLDMGG